MAEMNVFHEINALVPLLAVVGLNDVLFGCGLGCGPVRRQCDFVSVPLQTLNRLAAGRKLLQVFGKVPDGFGVGLVLQFGWAAVFKWIIDRCLIRLPAASTVRCAGQVACRATPGKV